MRTSSCLAFILLASTAAAQRTLYGANGATGIQLGYSIEGLGDTNGDGYEDFVVGAPGISGGMGGIYCLSGKRLGTGATPTVLWSLLPATLSADAAFGRAVTRVGDLNGDGVADLVVGAPYDDSNGTNAGAIYLVSGATHLIIGHVYGATPFDDFGFALDGMGDMNADGLEDVAVGAPLWDSVNSANVGIVYKVSGLALRNSSSGWALGAVAGILPGERLGTSVLAGLNLDGDLDRDLVAGAPYADFVNSADVGVVRVYDGTTLAIKNSYYGAAGDFFGWKLDGGLDYDGDGHPDVIVGAPYSDITGTNSGRVVVLSGYDLYTQLGVQEIYDWPGPRANSLFGSAVLACYDVNDDGSNDILVGASGYVPLLFGNDNGAVMIYSGETGDRLGTLYGDADEFLGDALERTLTDLDSDGARDFVVCGSSADALAINGGVVYGASIFPSYPSLYCTAKTNSQGCLPTMSNTGNASATSASAFTVRALNELNQQNGLMFYGFDSSATPFQGGWLCVKSPTKRTGVQNSGGSASGSDCTGSYALDFNAFIQGGSDPELVLGQEVYCQYWSRDPASASTTCLTNAMRFVINP